MEIPYIVSALYSFSTVQTQGAFYQVPSKVATMPMVCYRLQGVLKMPLRGQQNLVKSRCLIIVLVMLKWVMSGVDVMMATGVGTRANRC
jgi:hypothetical protein